MADLNQFAARLQLRQQRELFAYWRSKVPEGKLPARSDIDPVDIPALLPWITLVDVDWSNGQPRFRLRLVGTAVVERFGRDVTGMWFEEAYRGDILKRQDAVYSEAAEGSCPVADSQGAPIEGKEFIISHRLILPLADDGVHVDRLIALILFGDTMPAVPA
jgi:hypothetical protein